MNIRFLESLVVLARVRSFSETARVLNATQAAISQRIASLEDELGAPLVERGARVLALTPMGEQVVRQAERILQIERDLLASAKPGAPPAGRVRIGAIESVVHTWLSPLVRALAERLPQIEPDITVDTSRNLQELFRQRGLDLMVQNDAFADATGSLDFLRLTPLCQLPVEWIAAPQLVGARRRIGLAELARLPLLTFSRTSSPQAHLRALFLEGEAEPRICNFPSVQSIIQLVAGAYGVAAIPAIFVRRELEAGTLRRLEGPALPPLVIGMATRRDAGSAVQATHALACEVSHGFCTEAGEGWAQSLMESVTEAPAESVAEGAAGAAPVAVVGAA